MFLARGLIKYSLYYLGVFDCKPQKLPLAYLSNRVFTGKILRMHRGDGEATELDWETATTWLVTRTVWWGHWHCKEETLIFNMFSLQYVLRIQSVSSYSSVGWAPAICFPLGWLKWWGEGIFASLIKHQQADFSATRLHTREKYVGNKGTIRIAKR